MRSIVAHRSLSLVLTVVAASQAAYGTGRDDPDAAITRIGARLTGRYDNSAQVTAGKAMKPPPQHVTITIEPTPQPDWQLWTRSR